MKKTGVQVVYVDVLFIVNLILNYYILLAVSRLLRREDSRLRLLCGAGVGAVYAVLVFFPNLAFFSDGLMKIPLSLIIVGVSYRFRTAGTFLKLAGCFYLISFLFGGAVYAVCLFISPAGLLMRNGAVYYDISPVMLILAASACYVVLTLASRMLRRVPSAAALYTVRITVGGQSAELRALMDTGNELCDALSGLPVVVVEYQSVEKIIPPGLRPFFRKGELAEESLCAAENWRGRVRMVPYGSVGTQQGLLPAFRPDSLIALSGGNPELASAILVAVSGQPLSRDGRYQALLNPQAFPHAPEPARKVLRAKS